MTEIPDLFDSDIDEGTVDEELVPLVEPEDDADDLVETSEVVGEPTDDADRWFVQTGSTCVPATLTQIVAEYTGRSITDEQALTELALELGLGFTEDGDFSGMTEFGAEALLESVGIPATVYSSLTVDDLVSYLAEDRSVGLFVDADEVWEATGQGPDEEEGTTQGEASDHILLLTGIDVERGVAYLNDTGSPEGKMLEIPLEDLVDAWADGGFAAIVCDQPAPDDLPASPVPGGTTVAALTDGPWALLAAFVRARP
jgi:hypothetical protein